MLRAASKHVGRVVGFGALMGAAMTFAADALDPAPHLRRELGLRALQMEEMKLNLSQGRG